MATCTIIAFYIRLWEILHTIPIGYRETDKHWLSLLLRLKAPVSKQRMDAPALYLALGTNSQWKPRDSNYDGDDVARLVWKELCT
jgi:hypothetical protein